MSTNSKNFRQFHLLSLLQSLYERTSPLDVFVKNYFKSHRAIGSHDRRYLTETLYSMVRWQELVNFLSANSSNWEEKITILERLCPEQHLKNTSIPLHIRASFPKVYFDFLVTQIGEDAAVAFCLASNKPAPVTIRTNPLKISRDKLLALLSSEYERLISPGHFSPYAIHFAQRVNFFTFPSFKEGYFEVQDEGSQLLALQVKVKPGEHFLDYCAGSGGKTLAIAPQMQGKGQIYLHDIRPSILLEAKKRLKRAGIQNAQILENFDSRKVQQKFLEKMDWVLADVPCSGSGTLRRNPDMKNMFTLDSLKNTIELQRIIFAEALRFVKPKGYIVYATCSVFPEENDKQLAYFLENFPVTLVQPPFSSIAYWEKEIDKKALRMDGFYGVVLQKS